MDGPDTSSMKSTTTIYWIFTAGSWRRATTIGYMKKKGNDKHTADWEGLMRVNQFVRKNDWLAGWKRADPEIRAWKHETKRPREDLFARYRRKHSSRPANPYEELRYGTLYEPAFRKKELMYLEREDVRTGPSDASRAV